MYINVLYFRLVKPLDGKLTGVQKPRQQVLIEKHAHVYIYMRIHVYSLIGSLTMPDGTRKSVFQNSLEFQLWDFLRLSTLDRFNQKYYDSDLWREKQHFSIIEWHPKSWFGGEFAQWPEARRWPLQTKVSFIIFPLVTFYEDDMSPFLLKSPNIFCALRFLAHEGLQNLTEQSQKRFPRSLYLLPRL
jgi:hypothetical protein